MGGPLQSTNPTIVSAFESALVRQALVVLAILAVVAVAWNVLRSVQLRRAHAAGAARGSGMGIGKRAAPLPGVAGPATSEPAARRFLRIAFGCLWIFDGILQAQVSMPLGMPSGVIQPAGAGSPSWVLHLLSVGVTIWNDHPVTAAAAVVWIQVGIGVWLLVAPRGYWSRLAGLSSVGWGLVVWVFGEAFGSIFAPGLSWLFGAPGGVLFYVVAGALVAFPERFWQDPRLGRRVLSATGVFFVAMAVLQAWPGRGFWQGQATPHATAGELTSMARQMAQTPQPGFLSSWVSSFGSFDAAHGWGVNLFVVTALALIGVGFMAPSRRLVLASVAAAAVLCTADWVLVQDLGFFGGVGTDPNSMIPMALVLVGGYVAMTRVAPESATEGAPRARGGVGWREWVLSRPTYVLRCTCALGAVGIILVGAAPMAFAAADRVADPILYEAMDGPPVSSDVPAPSFALVDQYGQDVSLRALRGKAVALTFLDPVCTTDCPVIAQEFHEASRMLGSESSRAEFVAVVANPLYRSVAVTRAFDREEGLTQMANWRYLTGSVSQLEHTWTEYGVEVAVEPAGAMVAHSEIAYVIDPTGRTRYVLDADPGLATSATESSFAGILSGEVRRVLAGSRGSP